MTENIYETPNTDVGIPVRNQANKKEVPPIVMEHLRGTRPWVQFCSLAGYTTALFIIVIDFIIIRKMLGVYPPYQILLLATFYIILAILFVIPSIWLSRYEKSITRLNISQRIEDLEQTIAYQRTFWKQMSIMILFLLILYLITIGSSALILLAEKT